MFKVSVKTRALILSATRYELCLAQKSHVGHDSPLARALAPVEKSHHFLVTVWFAIDLLIEVYRTHSFSQRPVGMQNVDGSLQPDCTGVPGMASTRTIGRL